MKIFFMFSNHLFHCRIPATVSLLLCFHFVLHVAYDNEVSLFNFNIVSVNYSEGGRI